MQRVTSQADSVRLALEEIIEACMMVTADGPPFETAPNQLRRVATARLIRMLASQSMNDLVDVRILKVVDYMTLVEEDGVDSDRAKVEKSVCTSLIKLFGPSLRHQIADGDDRETNLGLSWDGAGRTKPRNWTLHDGGPR